MVQYHCPHTDYSSQGCAPGSWTQVAVAKTGPSGRVFGVDLLPTAPVKGAILLRGNFLSGAVQQTVRDLVRGSEGEAGQEVGRPARVVDVSL